MRQPTLLNEGKKRKKKREIDTLCVCVCCVRCVVVSDKREGGIRDERLPTREFERLEIVDVCLSVWRRKTIETDATYRVAVFCTYIDGGSGGGGRGDTCVMHRGGCFASSSAVKVFTSSQSSSSSSCRTHTQKKEMGEKRA